MGIAELGQGYPEFRGPPERVDQCRNIPHGIPRIVLLIAVTVDRIVALHATRIHREFKTGTAGVVGIDDDLDLIAADALVAAGEERLDAVRVRVKRPYKHVEVVVVVGDFGLSLEARLAILARDHLPEPPNRLSGVPNFFVVLPIDHTGGGRSLRHVPRRKRGRDGSGGNRGRSTTPAARDRPSRNP